MNTKILPWVSLNGMIGMILETTRAVDELRRWW
jgi:hypothetical protein